MWRGGGCGEGGVCGVTCVTLIAIATYLQCVPVSQSEHLETPVWSA